MRKTITRALVVLAMATGIGAVAAAPAQAAYSDCTVGYVCLWNDSGGVGFPSLVRNDPPGTCYNVPTFWNDKMDSFSNRLLFGKHVQFYKDANCTGHLMHQQNNNRSSGPFGSDPVTSDNFLSSINHNDRNILTSIWFNNG